jgi:hypothetical protein
MKPIMPTPALTRDILLASLAGFQLDKQRIDAKIAEVQAMLDGGSPGKTPPLSEEKPKKGRRRRSAAVRKRMADGQKARWAKIKAESEPSSTPTPEAPKAKRQISEEGMKRIIAATKKRWRLQRAAAKSAPAKKAVKKAVKKSAAEAAI